METIIFANGEANLDHIRFADSAKVIAADGGVNHCIRFGITPDVLIGDLDSVDNDTLVKLQSAGVEVIRHPVKKDETDLELAINYAIEQGAKKITLYGLLGGRWDMSFANVMLLASPKYTSIEFKVVNGSLRIFILRGGQSVTISGNPGDLVSALPIGGDAEGICYTGLEWPLDKGQILSGSPLGMSNQMLEAEATIGLGSGTLLIFHDQQEALSEED